VVHFVAIKFFVKVCPVFSESHQLVINIVICWLSEQQTNKTHMKTLKFSIVTRKDFTLSLIHLIPAIVFDDGSKFEQAINGVGDGVTGFVENLVEAHKLHQSGHKQEAVNLLFLTGLGENQTLITGEERIQALKDCPLADPDLLFSLVKQEGQVILRWLYDTFGVTWMEALRRTFLGREGLRFTLCLYRRDGGHWVWSNGMLNGERGRDKTALVLTNGKDRTIEIITQQTVASLAGRHPAGAGYRDQDDDGDCDCNGGD
jgi:hypothetical protein